MLDLSLAPARQHYRFPIFVLWWWKRWCMMGNAVFSETINVYVYLWAVNSLDWHMTTVRFISIYIDIYVNCLMFKKHIFAQHCGNLLSLQSGPYNWEHQQTRQRLMQWSESRLTIFISSVFLFCFVFFVNKVFFVLNH